MIKRKDLLIFSDEKIVSNIVKYEEEDIYISGIDVYKRQCLH